MMVLHRLSLVYNVPVYFQVRESPKKWSRGLTELVVRSHCELSEAHRKLTKHVNSTILSLQQAGGSSCLPNTSQTASLGSWHRGAKRSSESFLLCSGARNGSSTRIGQVRKVVPICLSPLTQKKHTSFLREGCSRSYVQSADLLHRA